MRTFGPLLFQDETLRAMSRHSGQCPDIRGNVPTFGPLRDIRPVFVSGRNLLAMSRWSGRETERGSIELGTR